MYALETTSQCLYDADSQNFLGTFGPTLVLILAQECLATMVP